MLTTRAAVLVDDTGIRPYADRQPLIVEELTLDAPGHDEVLVEVAAVGLCHSDLSVVDGNRPRPLPMVLGHEGAGFVREKGPGVTGLEPGDLVVFSFVPSCGSCARCQSGRPALCAAAAITNRAGTLPSGSRPFARTDGTRLHQHLGVSCLAELTVTSIRSVVKVDSGLSPERAALFGCALQTGVGAVVNTAAVNPGTSVAIFGLGGVGMAAVMGAHLAGAHPVIAVDPVLEKREVARRLGATHALAAGPDAVAAVRDLTGGGVAFAFEAAGLASVMGDAYAATAAGGTTVAVGLPHPNEELRVPAHTIVGEERRIVGSYMGSCAPQRDIPRLIDLHMAGKLPVEQLISGTTDLDGVNASLDALHAATVLRQIILPRRTPAVTAT